MPELEGDIRKILSNLNAYVKFIQPGFEYIDRAKASIADQKALDMETTSKSQIIMASGQDPEAVFRQQAEDEAKIRKYREEYGLPPERSTSSTPDPNLTPTENRDTIEDDKDDEDKDDSDSDKEDEDKE